MDFQMPRENMAQRATYKDLFDWSFSNQYVGNMPICCILIMSVLACPAVPL
jgi:hypothetical protein